MKRFFAAFLTALALAACLSSGPANAEIRPVSAPLHLGVGY